MVEWLLFCSAITIIVCVWVAACKAVIFSARRPHRFAVCLRGTVEMLLASFMVCFWVRAIFALTATHHATRFRTHPFENHGEILYTNAFVETYGSWAMWVFGAVLLLAGITLYIWLKRTGIAYKEIGQHPAMGSLKHSIRNPLRVWIDRVKRQS